MSCNPAIGGIGKGHLVREIDALGRCDGARRRSAGIQFRTLNASKGPAVRATRAQADRQLYKRRSGWLLENQPGLSLFQQEVADLVIEGGPRARRRHGQRHRLRGRRVVLTVGTFLAGRIHVG
jgi:tRNA uridine 5-carboxymethylaminomethyl modification enzyme